jgi:hypothetical protein
MIDRPMAFEDAIRFLLEKDPNPQEWDAGDWGIEKPAVRVRSFFSSRVESARFLDRAQGLIFDYLTKVRDDLPNGERALRVGGREDFVMLMRSFMIEEGMAKPDEFQGVNQADLQDIRSVSRLRLIFDTNVRQAYGFGQWKQGMKPAVRRAFPAARFVRDRGVLEPRPRHAAHAGEVRLKTDLDWWARYQNDPKIGGFGVPWGPYGFYSGMGQEDVSKAEAQRLGLKVEPSPEEDAKPLPGLNDALAASVRKMDPDVKAKLLAELRGGPKPRDAEEAGREAAAAARRAALERRGLPAEPPVKVVDEGEMIRLATESTQNPPAKAGEDISPKLRSDAAVTPSTGDAFQRAMAAIDAVHGDGPLREIPFVEKPNPMGSSLAYYNPSEGRQKIALERYEHPEMSIVHEVGHWLDHIAFWRGPGDPEPMTAADTTSRKAMMKRLADTWGSHGPEFQGFMDAAKASASIRSIAKDPYLSERSRNYLLSPHEIFARAYAQWIAVESGDTVMLTQIEKDLEAARNRSKAQSQWDWGDFDLVRRSIAAIFKARGWMRK